LLNDGEYEYPLSDSADHMEEPFRMILEEAVADGQMKEN
jgi:hypothetical protein